ncbi:MAG: ECF transporter S component [Candidatus Bathyarchaeia archaeon]
MNTVKIAIIAVFCAISIGTDYAMFSLWNIKLMDFIVFVGGFCFGPVVGVLIGVISWTVYGTLNPQGFVLPVLLATMFSETIYGIAGGLLRKGLTGLKGETWKASVFFASVGALLTLIYDVITNVVFGLTAGWNVVFAVVVGFIPFGLLHEISNLVFFGVGSVPVISAINKVVGGERNVGPKE